ncbi:MAG: hypothetical protein GOU98_02840 [Candidatus Altiarchaeota archaeon]|nr:hypothetical protein [Candidatus Altiarchaeota archaeon]
MKIPLMGSIGQKPLWIGLFTHLDSVSRATLDILLKLKGMGIKEHGKEYFVTKTTFNTLKKFINVSETRVGGNAGNAAYFLGKLGISCHLSAPYRPKELMKYFDDLPVSFHGVREKTSKSAIRDDPIYEHISLELFPPLSQFKRTILSWDDMTTEGHIDKSFWSKMKDGILLLSGFHLIKEKEKIDEVISKIQKNMKVYLEVGEPNENMAYAIDKLIEEKKLHHIGMNEREAKILFNAKSTDAKEIKDELGCGVTIHTIDYVTSTNKKLLRPLIDIIEAWTMGDLRYYKQVITLPLKRSPNGVVPTRSLPFVAITTGLGDSFSGLDAIRVFDEKRMEKIVNSLPLYGSDKFPAKL